MSNFMRWWKSVNDVLKAHGQPDLLYGDARAYYNQHFGS